MWEESFGTRAGRKRRRAGLTEDEEDEERAEDQKEDEEADMEVERRNARPRSLLALLVARARALSRPSAHYVRLNSVVSSS